jgi:MFS family permease
MSAGASNDRMLLWQYPGYGWFWCSRVAGAMAFQIQGVAVGWQVYALTGSTFQLGMVGLAQFLPIVLFTLVTGQVVDRFDRRRVYAAAIALHAAAGLVLAVGTLGGWLHVPGIYALLFVIGAARAFQMPSTQALLPTLVPPAVLPRAIAWSSGAFQVASIAGPALGGLLYIFGPAVPYAVAAALMTAATVIVAWVPSTPGNRARPGGGAFEGLFSGIHFIRDHSIILGSISLDLFAVLLGGATALLPVYASDILHVGSRGLGALRAAPAVGSLIMSVYIARRPPQRRVGRQMFVAVAIFGLTTIAFGLSRSFLLSVVILAVLGAADTVSVVIRSSLVQMETPDAMRGRVAAVNSLFIGTSNQLGEFESGVTASLMGTVPAVVWGGVGTLVVALAWMRLFPALREFDRFNTGGPRRG